MARTRTQSAESRTSAHDPTIPDVHVDVAIQLTQLFHSSSSQQELYLKSCKLLAAHFGAPYAKVRIQSSTRMFEREFVDGSLSETTCRALATSAHLTAEVERYSTAEFEDAGGRGYAILGTPVSTPSGESLGAMTFVVRAEEPQDVRDLNAELTAYMAIVRFVDATHQTAPNASSPRNASNHSTKGILLASSHSTMRELIFAIVNGLKNKYGCEDVALGLVIGKSVRLACISGLDDLYPRSPGSTLIRDAMIECFDLGSVVCEQRDRDWDDCHIKTGLALHGAWKAGTADSNCLSMLICEGETCVAVASFRRPSNEPFKSQEITELEQQLRPIGPALALAQRAERSLVAHLGQRARQGCRDLLAPGRPVRRALAIVALCALIWFVCGKKQHTASVPCRIASSQVTVFAAPFEGAIKSVPFREGDQVRTGDLLLELDVSPLELRRLQLESQRALEEMNLATALSDNDPPAAARAEATIETLDIEARIVNKQICAARVYAQGDGTIANGDLRKRVGEIVPLGEPLVEFVAQGKLSVELLVSESDIAELKKGQEGEFILNANPSKRHALRIRRIEPTVTTEDGGSFFVCHADIEDSSDWHRMGMDGVAHISVGQKRVWWSLLHKPLDFMRLKAWQL